MTFVSPVFCLVYIIAVDIFGVIGGGPISNVIKAIFKNDASEKEKEEANQR